MLVILKILGFQWPGTAGGHPPSPWEYELVVVNEDANNKKAQVRFTKPFTELTNIIRYGERINCSLNQKWKAHLSR